ncbi:MAG: hypothetical protein FJX59_00770 [Alphaproteobacteria bacterium]|nr:hypothetical protein [Alphaproteobacteria bacterium]
MLPLLASVIFAIAAARQLAAAEPMELRAAGFIDLRLAHGDDAVSWLDRGPGKTRLGGPESAGAQVAEVAAIVQARLTWDISAVAHVVAGAQQRPGVDAIESFLAYKPAPRQGLVVRAKAGAFFPPISLENTGLAWTSPYTLSSSALNSWVGEELRTIGVEGSAVRRSDAGEWSLTGAVFGFNDPVGSVLARRGWAIHDRETGLFGRLPLAPLAAFRPGGSAAGQANDVDPVAEIDGRVGWYAAGEWAENEGVRVRALVYDNRSNDRSFNGEQYAWHTRFGAIGGEVPIGDRIELVAQAMSGRTKMASPVVDNRFHAAFALASYAWDRHRLSARVERFTVKDRDRTGDDPNGERGRAWTAAYVFRPDDRQRLTIEALHVRSSRDARPRFGLPRRVDETLLQLSYRYFYDTR